MFIKDKIGNLLGYGGCKYCGKTWWRNTLVIVSLPICHGKGLSEICESCWDSLDIATQEREKRGAIALHLVNESCMHTSIEDAQDCLAYDIFPPLCAMTASERSIFYTKFKTATQDIRYV